LRPMHLVNKVHAVLLTGGSAFGLAAADGVVRYLEERGVGFKVGTVRVTIVPAAVIFDLGIGDPSARPGPEMGYAACLAAHDGPIEQGNVGAGAGATVGKLLGMAGAMKSGLGSATRRLAGGVRIAALAVVNSLGDVVDPTSGQILAGVRPSRLGPLSIGGDGLFANSLELMNSLPGRTILRAAEGSNTLLAVVATNARLSKEQANIVAQMAHDGVARAVRPAHTMLDGDTVFCLALGPRRADVNLIGAYAAEVLADAILAAVRSAHSAGDLPGLASGYARREAPD
jgi:L-aminopeptidase/D-esterase-like protein